MLCLLAIGNLLFRLTGLRRRCVKPTSLFRPCMVICLRRKDQRLWKNLDLVQGIILNSYLFYKFILLSLLQLSFILFDMKIDMVDSFNLVVACWFRLMFGRVVLTSRKCLSLLTTICRTTENCTFTGLEGHFWLQTSTATVTWIFDFLCYLCNSVQTLYTLQIASWWSYLKFCFFF